MVEQKCCRCEQLLPIERFKPFLNGGRAKTCDMCLERAKAYNRGDHYDKRICRTCGEVKPIDEFQKRGRGWLWSCQTCNGEPKKGPTPKSVQKEPVSEPVERVQSQHIETTFCVGCKTFVGLFQFTKGNSECDACVAKRPPPPAPEEEKKEEKYKCEFCEKVFFQKIDYTRHVNRKNACISLEKVKELSGVKGTEKKEEKPKIKKLRVTAPAFVPKSEAFHPPLDIRDQEVNSPRDRSMTIGWLTYEEPIPV